MLAGVVFHFLIMPGQIEEVGYGRIIPSTVPSIMIWIVIATAAVQLFTGKETVEVDRLVCARTLGFFALLAVALACMSRFGFEFIAPLLALAVMLAIGERRWYWLLLGGAVIPIGVWLIVERVLDRVLV